MENLSYTYDTRNMTLTVSNETKVSSYDISRHDEPIAEMKYADGTKVLIFKALGIVVDDCKVRKIWLQKERRYCISIKGEYKFKDHLDFEDEVN